MKLREVHVHRRKQQLEVVTRAGDVYPMPFVKLVPRPTRRDPIVRAVVDPELAREAVTYTLASGREGSVHLDHLLSYNRDPAYLARIVLHELSVQARQRLEASGLSRREVARRLGTSAPQVYRLLDPANTSKSFTQTLALLQVLDCDVELKVKPRRTRTSATPRSRSSKAAA